METAAELGLDPQVVLYLRDAPDETRLRELIAKFDGPATELVRRDANFERLGLSDGDVQSADQVVTVLAAHPELLQRPLLETAERVVIGRPKDAATSFLRGLTR